MFSLRGTLLMLLGIAVGVIIAVVMVRPDLLSETIFPSLSNELHQIKINPYGALIATLASISLALLLISAGLCFWVGKLYKIIKLQEVDIHEFHGQIAELMQLEQNKKS